MKAADMLRGLAFLLSVSVLLLPVFAAEPPSKEQFPAFTKAQGASLQARHQLPASKEEWLKQRTAIREGLERSWGGFPAEPCPLEPKLLGTVQRNGYRVEKLIFQTMPGIWMTALAYVPDKPGKHPAILHVHGHWAKAKQDPVLQARCIGSVKQGFFAMAVDAFGAGERGLGKALGEYHGEMVGATLFPTGRPLSGIQVYENMRAVDYLQSRPEVDPARIGITGASGGGNQSMYAGCYDDRFGGVIPTCSVGNYQTYLNAAACMCEVVPSALTYTEEWGVLGLAAPRGLMVINSTKDVLQFSVREARKSLVNTQEIYNLFGVPDNLFHAVFRWHHDYSQAMREAMYGWMKLHLAAEGNGDPIADTPHEIADPEEIRCFPNGSRPDDWITLPQFAAAEGRKLIAQHTVPKSAEQFAAWAKEHKAVLTGRVLGGFPPSAPLDVTVTGTDQVRELTFVTEPGLSLTARWQRSGKPSPGIVLLLNLDGAEAARKSEYAAAIQQAGRDLITVDLRATGALAVSGDKIGRAPDHNSAQWGLWIGRPLLGQWAYDVRRVCDAMESQGVDWKQQQLDVIGQGPAGLVALTAAALDDRIDRVTTVGSLASYISDVPYVNQRVGIIAPGILRDVGDVAHLAALCLPRPVSILGCVNGGGEKLSLDALKTTFAPAQEAATLLKAPAVRIVESADPAELLRE